MIDLETYLNTAIPIKRELELLFGRQKSLTILDIGSCTGEDSLRYQKLFPSATVYAFEPLPANVITMRQHFTMFNGSKIKIIEEALADLEGECDFYVSSGNPDFITRDSGRPNSLFPKEWNKSSSLLEPTQVLNTNYSWLKFNEKIKVKTNTLSNFMKKEGLQKIDFIHMDVQGAELAVLNGAKELVRKIGAIWLEVGNMEFYKNQPLRTDVSRFLEANGFALIKDTSRKRNEGDCFYFNKAYFSFSTVLTAHFLRLINAVQAFFSDQEHI